MDIVQVLATGSKEFNTVGHCKLVRVGHKVQCLEISQLWEEERIQWLLRHVGIGEILRSRHHISVDFVQES